ncbi:hypothetical protein P7K49_014982 [Saguinus oedipus]|uniref:Uncharacterized protein n=1 Tax=Saguinus oedipus TaxID=9490 RepID=A0ABQ9V7Y2_SAGOE|nr:hypothetical protein P7K49_014982 [Saguinus oedipus]
MEEQAELQVPVSGPGWWMTLHTLLLGCFTGSKVPAQLSPFLGQQERVKMMDTQELLSQTETQLPRSSLCAFAVFHFPQLTHR